jgi:hypothetical protein
VLLADADGRELQLELRAVQRAHGPVLGDYIWVSSIGETAFAVWTDYRNTVPGTDVREAADDDTDPGADVLQCRDVLPDGSITATSARATAVSIRTSTET